MAKPLEQKIQVRVDGYEKATRAAKEYSRDSRRLFGRSSRDIERRSGRMGTAMKAAFAGAVAFISTQVVGTLRRAGQELFNIGTAAEETASKFNTVFGPASGQVQGFLDDFVEKTALANREAQDFAAQFGGLFQGVGASTQEAADLSEQLVALAGDLSSFNNRPIEEALSALQSALVGETEALRSFNIAFRQTQANQAALAQTGKESANSLTELERVMGRLAVITDRAGVQIGDLDRTLDSTQNQARVLRGEIRRAVEDFSQGLLPTFSELIDFGNQLREQYGDGADSIGESFASFISRAVSQTLLLADAAREMGATIRNAFEALRLAEQGSGLGFVQEIERAAEQIRLIERTAARITEAVLQITVQGNRFFGNESREQAAQQALEEFRRAREERQALIQQAQEQREEGRRLFELESGLNDLLRRAADENSKISDEVLADTIESLRQAEDLGGRLGEIYSNIVERLQAVQQARAATTTTGRDGEGSTVISDSDVEKANEALEKIAEAQRLRAQLSERERSALEEVIAAQEEIAELQELKNKLGEEAVADELQAAEARQDRAREALSSAKAYREAVAQAADAIGRVAARAAAGGFGQLGLRGDQRSVLNTTQTPGGDRVISASELQGLDRLDRKLKKLKENGIELGDALQNIGSAVRSVTRLADVFGDLSDEARNALGGISDILDNAGRLSSLIDEAGGLGKLLDTGGGIASAAVPALGIAAGGASLIASALQSNNEELKRHLDALRENARALEDNTDAIFEASQIGAGTSEADIEAARAIIEQLRDTGMGSGQRQDLFADLAGFPGLGGIDEVADSLFDALKETNFGRAASRSTLREIINALLFDGADPEQVGDIFGIDLESILGSEFESVRSILDRLSESLGTFSDTVDGAADRLQFLQRRTGLEGDAAADRFLRDVLDIEGLSDSLRATLQEALNLDTGTQEGRARLDEIIAQVATALASGSLSLGSLSPDDVERLLDVLDQFTEAPSSTESAGSQDELQRRSVAVARTITEFQANELLAYQQEQVFLLREIVRSVAGSSALARVGATTAPGIRLPSDILSSMNSHLAAIRSAVEGTTPVTVSGPAGSGPTINITVNGAGRTGREIAQELENRLRRRPLK